jgi:hypothetical protein
MLKMSKFNYTLILILILGIICISLLTFTVIYYLTDETLSFDDALYYSVQIQTNIGAIDISEDRTIKNIVTTQSLIAYILGILLVIIISIITSRKI